MLEATFRYDTEGQTVRESEGYEVRSTTLVRAKIYICGTESVILDLYRVCQVCGPNGVVLGTRDVPIAQASFAGGALNEYMKGWIRVVDLCGANAEETQAVVHRMLFEALANVPAFREAVTEALPQWMKMLGDLWDRSGPAVSVTLDWGGVWHSLTVRPMGKRPTLDDTRGFAINELERCRDACLDAADMLADRIAEVKQCE